MFSDYILFPVLVCPAHVLRSNPSQLFLPFLSPSSITGLTKLLQRPSMPPAQPFHLDCRLAGRERKRGAVERAAACDTHLQTCSCTDAASWAGASWVRCDCQGSAVSLPATGCHFFSSGLCVGNSHSTSVPHCCRVSVVLFSMSPTKAQGIEIIYTFGWIQVSDEKKNKANFESTSGCHFKIKILSFFILKEPCVKGN